MTGDSESMEFRALQRNAVDIAKRREAHEFARGSLRLEGLVCSDEALALHEKWILGEYSSEELTAALLKMYKR
ncbi:antitoxin VbhA family protein [Actimicrobium sp. CCI2.3]|jgi:hypothetical protein|uniref:antitoxin VbhA family protein n=1 Tax=Actimicrobium sp. CCI2.3 TaxID=3048616 RepID=UPI002B2562D3|nr:antitoxin VbhA family protein [Actimicrobium sp. CCI2.3]MEB0023800.1 antitoxin VbhA family protein [Actimicrobium sp. CCI2.3]